ncbi:MAG: LytTR family DNA-binding domain-containing protein [Bacteroidales bacterium]|nr:LytTR family DNA-binding domain-containing protein [Bacteroidales bacterium]
MNVLIIEDEPFAQQELIRLIKEVDTSLHIERCIDSIEESVLYLSSKPEIDLIFMDIQLSDGLSFEIFNKTEVIPPVIFTTAYDEYAIKAFKVNSIDYLLKPVDEIELEQSLEKFKRWQTASVKNEVFFSKKQLEEVLGLYRPSYKNRLVVRLGDKIQHVETKDIACFYSEDKVSFLITAQGKRYIINYSLEQIEGFIDPAIFYRLNRQYIANIKAIASIDKYFNSRLKIGLNPEVEDDILVSRTKVSDFLNWLER